MSPTDACSAAAEPPARAIVRTPEGGARGVGWMSAWFVSSGSRASASAAAKWLPRGLLLLAWAAANESALRWMGHWLAQPVHLVQRTVLIGLAVLGAWDFLTRDTAARGIHPRAWTMAWLGLGLLVAARYGTEVNTLQALAAFLMLGALSACVTDAQAWRQRMPVLALMLLCLPVQSHVDAHLGLPLRLWTAQAIAPLLQSLGVGNVSVESIIVTENGVADVASACSGVRTLWYAMALWLCARLAWPQAHVSRWWLAGVLSASVAVAFNALRVAALVWALDRQAPPLIAEMAHASLGLVALAAVAALNAWLGRPAAASRSPDASRSRDAGGSSDANPVCPEPVEGGAGSELGQPPAGIQTGLSLSKARAASAPPRQQPALSWRRTVLLAAALAGVALLPLPMRLVDTPVQHISLHWPAAFQAEAMPLLPSELTLVTGRQARIAEKQRFHLQGLEGSLLVVQSQDWRAHHAPELCLLAQGARIDRLERVDTPNGAFRVMTMQSGRQVALTWFQAGDRIVPDLRARLWSQLWRPDETWTLVTVVIDSPLPLDATPALHRAVHQVVAAAAP